MSEFKVGDRVEVLKLRPYDKLPVGTHCTIECVWGDGTCAVKEGGDVYPNESFKLVTPKYRHGDVYEAKATEFPNVIICRDGGGNGCYARTVDTVAALDKGCNPISTYNVGKFLYNVFDKESATTDCERTIQLPCAPEIGDIVYVDTSHGAVTITLPATEEDNTKEAIMPINIETPTLLNGKNIEKYENADIGCILRDSVEEAKAAELLAKETKSTTLKADAAKIRKDIAALTKLLDERD